MSQIGEMIFKHESVDRDQFRVSGRSVETWDAGSEMKQTWGPILDEASSSRTSVRVHN